LDRQGATDVDYTQPIAIETTAVYSPNQLYSPRTPRSISKPYIKFRGDILLIVVFAKPELIVVNKQLATSWPVSTASDYF
jgi:hypothetical protein